MAKEYKDKPMDDEQRATELTNLITTTEESRFRYTQKWYSNIAFFENNHFVGWNSSTRSIDKTPIPKGRVMRMIPKARRQIKAIQNMILSNEIRWNVIPDEGDPEKNKDITKRVNQFIQDGWDRWNVAKKMATIVGSACSVPVAWWKIGYDKFKGDIYVDTKDGFDVLCPTYIDSDNYEDSPYFIESMRKSIGDLEDLYGEDKVKDVSPDNRMAGNDFKDYREKEKILDKEPELREYQTVITYVLYKKKKREKVKNLICRTVMADKKILEYTEYECNNYPYVPYQTSTGTIYQPAMIEEFISVNKALDVLTSQIENYTNITVRGRYWKQKGNNVTKIVNEDGEIGEYTTSMPEQQQIFPLPNFLFSMIGNYEKWIEEFGVSSSALGKVPKGIRAYKAIESLKQSDYANLKIPIGNLQDSIQKLTEKIIDIAAENYLLPKTVYRSEKDVADNFQVIGEKGAKLGANKDVMNSDNPPVIIKGSYRVKCTIENGLSYTEEGKRDTLRELFTAGAIPKEMLLEGFKFSNVSDILDKLNSESNVSMIDTPDFRMLPKPLQEHILTVLTQPEMAINNPIANAQKLNESRKGARTAITKS